MNARVRSGLRPARAFTLVEVLLASAISAMLLTAAATAFSASARCIASNGDYLRCHAQADAAMNQIVDQVRCAESVVADPSGASIRVIRPPGQREPGEASLQYSFDAPSQRLIAQVFYDDRPAGTPIALATQVTDFRAAPEVSAENDGVAAPSSRLPLVVTCSSGSESFTIVGSATPRRIALR